MSATKIAASLRVSLTALMPKQVDSRVAVAQAWLHYQLHHGGRGSGECRPRVSAREAYPRRVERSTVTGGGIDNGPSLRIRTVQRLASDRRQPQDDVAPTLAVARMLRDGRKRQKNDLREQASARAFD
jgi:hypothetical protein